MKPWERFGNPKPKPEPKPETPEEFEARRQAEIAAMVAKLPGGQKPMSWFEPDKKQETPEVVTFTRPVGGGRGIRRV